MITIPKLLGPDELQHITQRLAAEKFVDGGETATGRAREVKHNLQMPMDGDATKELDHLIRQAMDRHAVFMAAALPLHIVPLRFSRYEPGMTYGWHTDNPVMVGVARQAVRTDLACTIFLSDPAGYAGGELALRTPLGIVRIKLAAGDAVLYPATSVHQVDPVTQGVRTVAVTWIQSLVGGSDQRQLLMDLFEATRDLAMRDPMAPELERLGAVRHNLLRLWGQT
ncbi:MAG: 2OG-Fe(II) oxygenase [Cyanobacteria bacterium RYN_339]|nr:2OG-Fe(II) oxygenase [Cyanobacteria bacterium RYN_339]